LRWHYSDSTGVGRVRSAQVAVDATTGRVGVRLTASRGSVALGADDAPLGVRIVVGASPLRCGAATFAPPTAKCLFSRTGTSVRCTR